jgi:hypothetical protein
MVQERTRLPFNAGKDKNFWVCGVDCAVKIGKEFDGWSGIVKALEQKVI